MRSSILSQAVVTTTSTMMPARSTALVLFLFLLITQIEAALLPGNITCYECNRYRGGMVDTCKEDNPHTATREGCYACLKVHTRMEMHNFWNKPKVVNYNSYTCVIRPTYLRPAGCYLSTGSRSLTKECYCYSNRCNSAYSTQNISWFTSLFLHLMAWVATLHATMY